eukprot:1063787_1
MGDFLPEVDLGTGFNVRQIVTGYFHACVISTLNTIKCWGSGYAGRLGYGDPNDRGENPNEMGDYLPEVDLGTEFDVLMIATGWQHTCALSTSNKVKCFGRNNYGQLGLANTNNRGDNANEMGDNLPEIDLGSGFVVTQIAVGGTTVCALSTLYTVKCWGRSGLSGQLGYGDTTTRGDNANEMGDYLPEVDLGTGFDVAQIATGCVYTCSLSTSNKVKCWGRNTLGYGDEIHRGDNANEMGDFLPEVDLGTGFNVRQIVTGYFHACVISTLNTIKCWGSGYAGRLGYGDPNDRGENPNEMGDYLPEVDLGTEFDVLMIATGWQHTCALSTSNKVKCFGRNNYGQLGLANTNNEKQIIEEIMQMRWATIYQKLI